MEEDDASTEQTEAPSPEVGVTRACDVCRKKKIRCEPIEGGCKQCVKYKTECLFTPVTKKRKPRRPAGFKHISKLEDRLKKMEGLLQSALGEHKRSETDEPRKESNLFGVFSLEQESTSENSSRGQSSRMIMPPPAQDMESGPDHDIDLSLDPQFADNEFFGGQRPLHYESHIAPLPAPLSWKGTLAFGPFTLPTFQELPAKGTALELVNTAFVAFNDYFPLFDEAEFRRQFEAEYTFSSPSQPAWWACINVVLCLAHRFRGMESVQPEWENAQACGYVHNALAVVSELNILRNSLPAIQGLVGMAVILQGTPNPHTSSVLIAAAVRQAQAMGMHRNTQDSSFTAAQTEQRRRVFWIAYFMDKDISLRMGQPFAQDDDDMDAELPLGSVVELPLCRDGLRTINFFNTRIGLAVIQGQIYKRLYSVQGARQSETHKATAAQELSSLLSYWRQGVPLDFEESSMAPLQPPFSAEVIHMIITRFTYINCLVMVHHHLPSEDTAMTDVSTETPFVSAFSESVCITESRKALRLLRMLYAGDYAYVWMLLHPVFAAVTILLDTVIQKPAAPMAASDLQIIEPFLGLLDVLSDDDRQCSRSEEAQKMRTICKDLSSRATEAVRRTGMRIAAV